MILNRSKKVFISLIAFCSANAMAFGDNVNDSALLKKVDNIEKVIDNLVKEDKRYEGDIKKKLDIDLYTSKIIEKVNNIDNQEKKKDVYKHLLKQMNKDYIENTEKHYFYLKGFVGSLGYGTDVSYYYKNFIGVGFIFNYQDDLFSNAMNKFLNFYSLLTSYTEEDDYKLNLSSQTYALYVTIRPWSNNFHFDAGISISKVKTSGYIGTYGIIEYDPEKDKIITVEKPLQYEGKILIDNLSPKPYINVGCDFVFHDFIFALDIGAMFFKTRKQGYLYNKLVNLGIDKGIISKDSADFHLVHYGDGYYGAVGDNDNFYMNAQSSSLVNPYIKISVGYRYSI